MASSPRQRAKALTRGVKALRREVRNSRRRGAAPYPAAVYEAVARVETLYPQVQERAARLPRGGRDPELVRLVGEAEKALRDALAPMVERTLEEWRESLARRRGAGA